MVKNRAELNIPSLALSTFTKKNIPRNEPPKLKLNLSQETRERERENLFLLNYKHEEEADAEIHR